MVGNVPNPALVLSDLMGFLGRFQLRSHASSHICDDAWDLKRKSKIIFVTYSDQNQAKTTVNEICKLQSKLCISREI